MSQEGGREAFCLLLWRANGGGVDLKSLTVTGRRGDGIEDNPQAARGVCTRPYDCAAGPNPADDCQFMLHEISQHPPNEVTWVCPDCLTAVVEKAKAQGISYYMAGHFSEGLCEYPDCRRPENTLTGDPPRFSMFRQIVFGAIR